MTSHLDAITTPLTDAERSAMDDLHVTLKVDNTVYYSLVAKVTESNWNSRYHFNLAIAHARELRDELDKILAVYPKQVREQELEAAE